MHAGLTVDKSANEAWILERLTPAQSEAYRSSQKVRGAIIGEVDIIDCVEVSSSPWFTGKYGFLLANQMLYDNPVPCKGKLGFFEPEIIPNQQHIT